MNKRIRLTIIFLLGILIILRIIYTQVDSKKIINKIPMNLGKSTFHSEYTTTMIYTSSGKLHYKFVANYVDYFPKQQVTWFTKPVATVFNESKVPTWIIKSKIAMLSKHRMLYLYGEVQINSLTKTSQLKCIKTDNASINLITQDIFSDDKVILYGINFNSTGMRMRGNIRAKTAQLLEKVKTFYENHKIPSIP